MIDILRTRRTTRSFQQKSVEKKKSDLLKESVLRSPSSRNINPWEFIFIDDKQTIEKLQNCKPHGAEPLKTAPLAVVICADENKNDVWIEDCSIASIVLQLTAQSIGLGSCWIQIRKRSYSDSESSEEYLQKLLGIPSKFRILSIIAIGYPVKCRPGKLFSELQFEKIRDNKF